MSSCGRHYGSKCSFSCAVGYRLNGSSTVTCVAPGNRPPGKWDHRVPVCQGSLIMYCSSVMSCLTDKQRNCFLHQLVPRKSIESDVIMFLEHLW